MPLLKLSKEEATSDYLKTNCNALNKNNIYCGCKKNKKYGDFCGKHKRLYLIDKRGVIYISTFTNNIIDYNVCHIINTIFEIYKTDKYYNIDSIYDFFQTNKNDLMTYSKKELLIVLNNLINNITEHFDSIKKYVEYYKIYTKDIIKIQSYIRLFLVKIDNKFKGPAYLHINKSCNEEDIVTLNPLNEIDNDFFFSYEDNNNRVWSFDIRSLKKMIDMKQDNPYNREEIPLRVKLNINKRIKQLKIKNISIDIEKHIEEDLISYINHRCIDIFQHINQFGYTVNETSFTCLSLNQLKLLYGYLEDVWNYRAQLSNVVKSNICPPNGVIFNVSKHIINNNNNKDDLVKILLDDIYKLVYSGIYDSDQKLGSMYFLIGLAKVNPVLYQSIPWLQYV